MLRHYKYTWALAGTLLLIITFLFGREVNGARLWIFLGPIGFQPGEAIKVVLVIFIAGYLAEKRPSCRRGHRAHRPDQDPAAALPAADAGDLRRS